MGNRKISVKTSAAESITAIAWYVESLGLIKTAEKFVDDLYNFIAGMADTRKSYPVCKE